MSIAVEIAVQDLAGLEIAAHAGADRVELCTDLERGGLTPPPDLVRAAAERAAALRASADAKPQFGVHCLIRSRAGDGDLRTTPGEFTYDEDEIATMARAAAETVEAGADGIVIGALTPSGLLDLPAIEQIRDAALTASAAQLRGLTLTCHRALDAMPDDDARIDAVTALIRLGFHRALTSGGAPTAPEGIPGIARMVGASEGIIDICAGGGIRPAHIAEIVHRTGATDIHLSARSAGQGRDRHPPSTTTDAAIATAAVDAAGAL
ncbi:MAG: copper homeostasis protein CutC [Brachybacterium sp.]|nr:copper homeostasis protein CutC [Brachybacterium sp.]